VGGGEGGSSSEDILGVTGPSVDSRDEDDPDRSRGGAMKVSDPREAVRRCLRAEALGRTGVTGVGGMTGDEEDATGESKVY